MSRGARIGLLVATIVGIVIAVAMIGFVGARDVARAMASIGIVGMAVLVAWTGGVLLLLGAAWHVVAHGEPAARLPAFVWARTTREAATDVLPFSQLGGLVVGARTLIARGIPQRRVYASMIVDMTTEMAAQLLCTLAGVAALLIATAHLPARAALWPMAAAGVAGMAVLAAVFAFGQRPLLVLAGRLGARLLPGSAGATAAIRSELDTAYRARGRVCAAFLLNLLAWVASAVGAYIALRFMGLAPPLWAVVALEMLIFTLRSVAFMIPGGMGVQEAVYVLLGPIFGVPPTAAVALSLLKRSRDLIIGVPALLAWHAQETAAVMRGA